MRIRLRTGRPALFGAMLVVALLVLLPLRLVMGLLDAADTGFAARAATGSVWAGRLHDAQFGALALGDLDAHLSPWQLFAGRARVDLAGRGADALTGAIGVSRHTVGVDDVSGTLPAGVLFAPLPVTSVSLDDLSVRFRGDGCERADGRLRATLAGELAGVPLGEALSGTVRCDGDALLVPLVSQAGSEAVTVRLSGNGRYTAVLSVRPSDPAAGQKLEAAGFSPGPGGETLSVAGHL